MIQKIVLRDQVKEYLCEQMLQKKLSFGQRLSLPEIANEVNVSVTPIREALTQLQQSGIVDLIPNRGFFLPHLSTKEASEIYPLISSLECLALENSNFTTKQIEELEAINDKILIVPEIKEVVKLDLKFHQTLVENYDNDTVKQILTDMKVRVFFYELEYMQLEGSISNSNVGHHSIIEQLKANNISMAILELKKNWHTSENFITTKYFNHA